MLKKIYSLAASLLIMSACTTDELVPVDGPNNKSEITLSFKVDVPTAEVISKASSPMNGGSEIGVEDLYLYTYNNTDAFIEKSKAKIVTATDGSTSYQAIISKDTRKIHFLSNCGVNGLPNSDVSTFDKMYTLSSSEYAFWGVKELGADFAADLGQINLFRNWAKLDVQFTEDGGAKTKLYDYSYMVYSTSKTNTLAARVDKEINLPAGLDWTKQTTYVGTPFGESSFLFENNNQSKTNGTVVIIKARYNDPSAAHTYYKIDLSKMEDEGFVKVYDVIRNHHYVVTIKDVAISGVATFAEAIDPEKPADNNITASTTLNDYPKITYDGETLIVTKTTYVFTQPGQGLNSQNKLQADYTIGSTLSNSKLKYVAGAGISTVTKNGVTLNANGSITTEMKDPTSTEQRGYFYITGGKLQRMITLVLRPAYVFPVFTLTEAGIGANSTVTAHFKVPTDIETAIFPLEFKFTSKKLYATESGVRIDTDGNGNYVYVYTAQEYKAGGYNVTFSTNSPNEAGVVETVALNAEYFNTATAKLNATAKSSTYTLTGTYRYGTGSTTATSTAIPSTDAITVDYGSGTTTFLSGANPKSITAPENISNVTLSYTSGNYVYVLASTISTLTTGSSVRYLTYKYAAANITTGYIDLYRNSNRATAVSTNNTNVTVESNGLTGTNAKYRFTIKQGADITQSVTITATINGTNRTKTMTLYELSVYTATTMSF